MIRQVEDFLHSVGMVLWAVQAGRLFLVSGANGEKEHALEWDDLHAVTSLIGRYVRNGRRVPNRKSEEFLFSRVAKSLPCGHFSSARQLIRYFRYLTDQKARGAYDYQHDLTCFLQRLQERITGGLRCMKIRLAREPLSGGR
ncbi:MAG: hypothetical protein Q8Q10_00610 [bacterium]|nr:hypothetical protein [bacterium]